MRWHVLLNQTSNLIVARLSLPIGALLILVAIGRVSDSLLGAYALITTYYFILQTLPLLGLTPFVMRQVARAPESAPAWFFSLGGLSVGTCILINIALHLGLPHSGYSAEIVQAIKLVGIAIVPGILAFTAEITLTSLHRAERVGRIALLENGLRVVLSLIVLWMGWGLDELVWILILSRSFALLAYCLTLVGVDRAFLTPRIDFHLIRSSFAVLPVFLLNALLGLLLSRMDFIFLSLFSSIEAIGYYAIGYRFFEVGGLVVTAALTAVFPLLARSHCGTMVHFRAIQRTFLVLVALLVVPLALVGSALAEVYVALMFTKQYPIPVALTQFFMLLLVMFALDTAMGYILHAEDRQDRDTLSLLCSAPVYAIALWWLVPAFGIDGALGATATALLVQLSARTYFVHTHIARPWSNARLLAFVLLMTLALLFGISTQTLDTGPKIALALAYGLVFNPLLLMIFGFIQTWRALVFFNLRKPDARTLSREESLATCLAKDLFRHKRWWRSKTGQRHPVTDWGFAAVVLYRASRACSLAGFSSAARLCWQLQIILCKCDIRPEAKIGSGLVIEGPLVGVAGVAGKGCTLMAHAASGRSGSHDCGAGVGMPILGNDNFFHPRATLLGGHRTDDKLMLPPCLRARNKKKLVSSVRTRS